jgi:hypothetical protein
MKDQHKIGAVYGALAFDLRVADRTHRRRLEMVEAEALAAALRRNLIAECADVRALRLTMGAAFYDPCTLLRIGWPLHRRLRALQSAMANDGDSVAAVGEDSLPEPQGLTGARFLLSLPFVLTGPSADAKDAARHFDRNRMLAYTPRVRNPAFELPTLPAFDAVGYLSLRSLSTEIGARYYADGLGDVWALIARALLQPTLEHRLDVRTHAEPATQTHIEPSPLRLQYANGRVRMAGHDGPVADRCRILLEAHGLNVVRAAAMNGEDSHTASERRIEAGPA